MAGARPHVHEWEERPVWDEAAGRSRLVRRCRVCGREVVVESSDG
jgi:hypothetical protein